MTRIAHSIGTSGASVPSRSIQRIISSTSRILTRVGLSHVVADRIWRCQREKMVAVAEGNNGFEDRTQILGACHVLPVNRAHGRIRFLDCLPADRVDEIASSRKVSVKGGAAYPCSIGDCRQGRVRVPSEDHDGRPRPARRRLRLGGAAAARQGGRSYTTLGDTTESKFDGCRCNLEQLLGQVPDSAVNRSRWARAAGRPAGVGPSNPSVTGCRVRRTVIAERALFGLKDRLMSPGATATAVRT